MAAGAKTSQQAGYCWLLLVVAATAIIAITAIVADHADVAIIATVAHIGRNTPKEGTVPSFGVLCGLGLYKRRALYVVFSIHLVPQAAFCEMSAVFSI
ncbi:hypothetical protein [Cohnella fermenti]|uniref:Uncharacterized protein n=1 Tax=Cohnella fermenti TaxID=2565925 RepID=A0A4S4BQZ6_9BACL|nr:hypothetical protein [Cohnella fermenti]THF76572.1 hypothetical protein E6C55_18740 [Cohnella fermenti]